MKKRWILAIVFIMLFCLSSCHQKTTPEETTIGGYSYTPATQSSQDSTQASDTTQSFSVDFAWQDNYNITYRYFDISQGSTPVTIIEKKTSRLFSASYLETGDTLYYIQNGNDIEQYILTTDTFTGAKNVMKNKKITAISSTFMKLSEVSPELPMLSNVMYMSDEPVAGRMCRKYIQRAYTGGEVQETVYVWVDIQYGFAAKCESYDASDEMTVFWDLVSFSSGDITDADVEINLNVYQITEKE